jgi:hypothetical protein
MALSNFLSDNKKRFLEDLEKDGGKEWTVVMGNEAGGNLVFLSLQ